jgi:ATP-dependent DNA helicase DinG
LNEASRNDAAARGAHDVFLPIVRAWAARTTTGDRAELEDLPEDLPFWTEVAATAETCLGTECPRYDDCFVTRMRQQAAASDLVIVNHHLLCADAAVRQSAFGEVIPACNHLVLDEAHQLEDVATQYFGLSVSTYRIEDLARDAERLAASRTLADRKTREDVAKAVDRLRDHARAFFSEVAFAHRSSDRPKNEERSRVTDASLAGARDQGAALTGALDRFEATFALIGASAGADADNDGSREAAAGLARRAGEIRQDVRFLLRASDPDFVYFVEFRAKGVFLRASPIDVSAIVHDALVNRMQTTIFTSATLTVDGRFDYVRARLGIRGAGELRLPSEFDFSRQAVLYLPPRMPDPRSSDFTAAAGSRGDSEANRGEGLRPLHQLRGDENRAGDRRVGAGLSNLRAGDRAEDAAAAAISRNAARRALRDLIILAGRRRRGRSLELRHRRQAAVRVAG